MAGNTKPSDATGAETKQAVLTDEDTKTGQTIRIRGLRGECAGAKFDNEGVAKDVNDDQLEQLRGTFKRAGAIEIL